MKLIYTLLLSTLWIALNGQIITSESLPKVNTDNSYYTSLNTDLNEISKIGNSQVWDMSGVSGGITTITKYENPSNGVYKALYPQATYFINEGGLSEVYYTSDAGGTKILGSPLESFINPGVIEKGELHPPVFEIKTPMKVGDNYNQSSYVVINIPLSIVPDSLLNSFPIKPDSLRLKNITDYSYECTGNGVLKCPGQDFNVLQQTANIITVNKLEAKLPFIGWIDISNLVDFGLGQEDLSTLITFWSPDHVGYVAQFRIRKDLNEIVTAKYTTDGTLLKDNEFTILDKEIDIYPNPFKDQIFINDANKNKPDYLQVLSIDGSIILGSKINGVQSLDLKSLVPGTYFIKLYKDGKLVTVKQTIKI